MKTTVTGSLEIKKALVVQNTSQSIKPRVVVAATIKPHIKAVVVVVVNTIAITRAVWDRVID